MCWFGFLFHCAECGANALRPNDSTHDSSRTFFFYHKFRLSVYYSKMPIESKSRFIIQFDWFLKIFSENRYQQVAPCKYEASCVCHRGCAVLTHSIRTPHPRWQTHERVWRCPIFTLRKCSELFLLSILHMLDAYARIHQEIHLMGFLLSQTRVWKRESLI